MGGGRREEQLEGERGARMDLRIEIFKDHQLIGLGANSSTLSDVHKLTSSSASRRSKNQSRATTTLKFVSQQFSEMKSFLVTFLLLAQHASSFVVPSGPQRAFSVTSRRAIDDKVSKARRHTSLGRLIELVGRVGERGERRLRSARRFR